MFKAETSVIVTSLANIPYGFNEFSAFDVKEKSPEIAMDFQWS